MAAIQIKEKTDRVVALKPSGYPIRSYDLVMGDFPPHEIEVLRGSHWFTFWIASPKKDDHIKVEFDLDSDRFSDAIQVANYYKNNIGLNTWAIANWDSGQNIDLLIKCQEEHGGVANSINTAIATS